MDVYVKLVISFDLGSASGYSVGGTMLHPYSSSNSARMQNECALATGDGHMHGQFSSSLCEMLHISCPSFSVWVTDS